MGEGAGQVDAKVLSRLCSDTEGNLHLSLVLTAQIVFRGIGTLTNPCVTVIGQPNSPRRILAYPCCCCISPYLYTRCP